jgi:hypothetical protein
MGKEVKTFMSNDDVKNAVEQVRTAVEGLKAERLNEVGPYHVRRHELLLALSAAVIAIGDSLSTV